MGRICKGIGAVTKCSQKPDDRTLEEEIVCPVDVPSIVSTKAEGSEQNKDVQQEHC